MFVQDAIILPIISRINEGIMRLKLVLGHTVSNDVSAYASQTGEDGSEKEDFHNTLEDTMCVISEKEDSHYTLEDRKYYVIST